MIRSVPCRLVCLAVVILLSSSASGSSLFSGEVGKQYSAARSDMIKYGSIPVDQTKNAERSCINNAAACVLYPELSSCAVDQPLCRFEWRSQKKRSFYVVTNIVKGEIMAVQGVTFAANTKE